MQQIRDYMIEVYLDRVNNYLTIEKFAEHNGLTNEQAKQFLGLAQSIFDSKHPEE